MDLFLVAIILFPISNLYLLWAEPSAPFSIASLFHSTCVPLTSLPMNTSYHTHKYIHTHTHTVENTTIILFILFMHLIILDFLWPHSDRKSGKKKKWKEWMTLSLSLFRTLTQWIKQSANDTLWVLWWSFDSPLSAIVQYDVWVICVPFYLGSVAFFIFQTMWILNILADRVHISIV